MSLKLPIELDPELFIKPSCDKIIEKLFKKMRGEYLAKFPRGKFIVLNMANSYNIDAELDLSSDISINRFLEYLKDKDIDYRDENLYQSDGHYGVLMYKHLANLYKKIIEV